MRNPEKQGLSPEEKPERAVEIALLKENRFAFFSYARDRYAEYGRGAVVIDASAEPLGEDTPFHYAHQARIEEQEDEVSLRLAALLSDYDPEAEFVAVFIRPGIEFEFSMYQIRPGENPVQAVDAVNREKRLTRISQEIAHLTQMLGESGQIIDEDIEQAKSRVNGKKAPE
jgi:hypothetical protein